MCKAIGDSSTPDEDIQNTQSDDNVVVVTATTQSDIPHDSEYSISRFRSMVTTLPPVVFLVCFSLIASSFDFSCKKLILMDFSFTVISNSSMVEFRLLIY